MKNNIKSNHSVFTKGFSLIELMVVVAIIAILAVIAVPAYTNYSVRAKFGDVLFFSDVLKNQAMNYYDVNGAFPAKGNYNFPGATTVVHSGGQGTFSVVNSSTVLMYTFYIPISVDNTIFIYIAPQTNIYPGQNTYTTTTGTLNYLMLEGVNSNSVWTWTCGGFANVPSVSVPLQYLPQNCQNMITVF